ncbi:hypothetical protein QP225_00635 [Aerococcus urinae]|nr:hypothetical protein [Aerococcus urinae]RAV68680.1 hypothetical protein DBT51_05020 [Aerococcus loyolae]
MKKLSPFFQIILLKPVNQLSPNKQLMIIKEPSTEKVGGFFCFHPACEKKDLQFSARALILKVHRDYKCSQKINEV